MLSMKMKNKANVYRAFKASIKITNRTSKATSRQLSTKFNQRVNFPISIATNLNKKILNWKSVAWK